jgi:group I intron endonuclease
VIGIYKITSPSGKVYIGQSTNIEKRWVFYYTLNCKGQTKLYNSLKKYTPEHHIFDIIEECDLDVLLDRETYYKCQYNSLIEGLNCRIDGKSGYDSPYTKERKRICKLNNTNAQDHIKSEQAKQQISDSMKKLEFYTLPQRTQKISQSKSIAINQLDLDGNFIKEWESAKQAAKIIKNKSNGSDIIACIKGRQMTAYGFIWKLKIKI